MELELFLHEHAMVHNPAVGQVLDWSFVDNVLRGLSEEQIRTCPQPGMNSIAWLFWHMARTEDVAINVLVAGRNQVLEDERWVERLKLDRRDIGTGMRDIEVSDFSARIDIDTLMAYRDAVGRRTREVVAKLRPEELNEPVERAAVEGLVESGALVERARRLADFWGGLRKVDILGLPATGHNFLHLGEALTVRRLVKV